jgi:hypothetical protein
MEYAHTDWRSDWLRTLSLEIRWTMYTHSGDRVDCVQSMKTPWTMHTQPGDPMNCVYTNWRSDNLCIYKVEIRWTVYWQTGDQLVANRSGSCRCHNYSVLARCLMKSGKLVTNKFKINWSSTIPRHYQISKGGFRKLASSANCLFWKIESICSKEGLICFPIHAGGGGVCCQGNY